MAILELHYLYKFNPTLHLKFRLLHIFANIVNNLTGETNAAVRSRSRLFGNVASKTLQQMKKDYSVCDWRFMDEKSV